LEEIVPANRILSGLEELYSYIYDASFGEYLPQLAIQPEDENEISKIMKLANKHQIPVYPRGSATSLSGGPLPVQGGIVLDMTRMNKKLIIDRENLLAIVSPGVTTGEIHQQAEKAGLFYPLDPSR